MLHLAAVQCTMWQYLSGGNTGKIGRARYIGILRIWPQYRHAGGYSGTCRYTQGTCRDGKLGEPFAEMRHKLRYDGPSRYAGGSSSISRHKQAQTNYANQCRCVMSESSHKCNVIGLRTMNFIIAVTTRVCHMQIA